MFKDRRCGKFYFSIPLLEQARSEAEQILHDVIIYKADFNFSMDAIEYHGISPHFDEVSVGQSAPEYTCNVTRDDNNEITWEWTRVK